MHTHKQMYSSTDNLKIFIQYTGEVLREVKYSLLSTPSVATLAKASLNLSSTTTRNLSNGLVTEFRGRRTVESRAQSHHKIIRIMMENKLKLKLSTSIKQLLAREKKGN